ncbi:MAG: hypothetical protein NVV74_11040 [Magnetospirillum sp.]|nr:hypothetical protein [Magnetospirillum sp.]
MRRLGAALAGLTALTLAASAAAEPVADKGCATLAARVDAVSGGGPVFLASYDDVDDEPALLGAAFTYDNALAAIALAACGDVPRARRVGAALLAAASADRADPLGRLRSAYRAGAASRVPQPHGWWDAEGGHWAEDPMQVGTATGNVAWAGLALLTVGQATGDARYRAAAVRLGQWAEVQAWDRLWGGFSGGVHGDGAGTRRLGWKSTEHNVDLAALYAWLGRSDSRWRPAAEAARAFVAEQWQPADGHFLTGTLPDGHSPNRATSGLDAQVWPLLLPDAPRDWRRVLAYVRAAHGVGAGFDFNDDRDGIWWEGTAQVALALAATGDQAGWNTALATLAGQFSPGGLIWASSVPRLTTGLALAPDSGEADFVYYRRPHLGATAWAVLAARRWNPFVGRPLP